MLIWLGLYLKGIDIFGVVGSYEPPPFVSGFLSLFYNKHYYWSASQPNLTESINVVIPAHTRLITLSGEFEYESIVSPYVPSHYNDFFLILKDAAGELPQLEELVCKEPISIKVMVDK